MFLQAFLPNITQFLEGASRALVLSVIAEHVNASPTVKTLMLSNEFPTITFCKRTNRRTSDRKEGE
jgi:ribosomal protein L11